MLTVPLQRTAHTLFSCFVSILCTLQSNADDTATWRNRVAGIGIGTVGKDRVEPGTTAGKGKRSRETSLNLGCDFSVGRLWEYHWISQ